jgi:hypothetical protein
MSSHLAESLEVAKDDRATHSIVCIENKQNTPDVSAAVKVLER